MMKSSVKKNNSVISSIAISLISLVIFSFVFTSCSKDPGKIGYVIQPNDSKLNVGFTDTTSIYGYSIIIDSIRSDKLSVSAFGSLRDPVFGSTTAGFYTQFIPSTGGHSFGVERTLDSLVLQLYYNGYYGDTNATLTAHVYEMLENIYKDSIYYSNKQIDIDPVDYSNFTFSPRPSDSIVNIFTIDTITDTIITPPALRINLSDINPSLGQKLLDATTDQMDSLGVFQEFFNGLFVQSQPIYEDGTMIYFGLTSANTKLSLYYSSKPDDTSAMEDSLQYNYYISATSATINKYEHDYNTADPAFKAQVLNHDTILGAQQIYAQGYGGIQSVIKIPHIVDWARLGNVAINEAKLVLPGVDNDKFFDAPYQMFLLEVGDDGIGIPLPDQYEGDFYFDGLYNESNNSYEFRITRYIQSLISDTTLPNNGLYLFLFGGSVHPERFIFKGNQIESDSSTRLKLEILYTDL
ncbi:MAG: DUF4270 family protein [Bacteroidota bacterium]